MEIATPCPPRFPWSCRTTITRHSSAALWRPCCSQDRAADEIIVIDDGSTDDSVAVIERIAATAPAIRLLRNPSNIGVIPTLQRGLQEARGAYVYFAASDDWVLPGFFALALRRLEADPDLGLFCGETVLVDGNSNKPFAVRPAVRPRMSAGRIDAGRTERLLRSTDNWIHTGSAVFRREAVTWAGGFDPRLGSFADGFIARKIALQFGFYSSRKSSPAGWCSPTASRARPRSTWTGRNTFSTLFRP